MNKWKEYELGQISEIHNGSTPSTKVDEYWNGDIVWITPKDLSDQNKKYIEIGERSITRSGLSKAKSNLLPIGTVLLSSRAPIGLISIAKIELVTNQGFKNIVVDSKKVNNEYLYYLLKLKKDELNNLGTGTTFKELSKSALEKYRLKLPILSDQQKIASVLSALDDKIELNNKINAELEAMAKTLYDYWFVQFDFPHEAGKPYKSSGGSMVYNEVLKREIPTGWEVHRLSTLTSFLSRGISPKYIEEEDGIPVLNQKCIREHRVLYEFQRRHDNEAKRASSKLIEKFDVLVNSTGVGTLGRVALVRWLNEEQVTVDSHVTIVRALGKKINRVFFGYSVLTKQGEIENFANGSTGQVELNRSQLSDITLLVPPTKFQNKFREFYEPIIEKTAINERQNQELAQLRNWLLPMLMNGQVKVNANSDSDNDERSNDTPKGINIAAEPTIGYQKLDLSAHNAFSDRDSRFESWLSQQGLAARGAIDTATLREIFNAMDDEDK